MSSPSLLTLIARCRVLCRPRAQGSDAELLARFVQQRDAAAFEELLERYAPLVWGVCRRIVRDEADSEDAFQAVFLALVRQAASLDGERPLGAWLHTVAVRVARKASVQMRRHSPSVTLPERATSGDVADEVSSRELFRAVDEEIARLPAAVREPLILCCLQGQTRDEAAEVLGCSTAAIKGRLERGRNLLRRRLVRRGVQLPAAFLVLGLTSERLRAGLWAKTMQSVLHTPSPAVADLAEIGLPILTAGKCKLLLAALLLVSSAAGAAGSLLTRKAPRTPAESPPQTKTAPEPKKPAAPEVRTDRHGDPLPEGAIRRFGTLRYRHQEIDELSFTPDGKRLIAGGRGKPLVVFDAITGRKMRQFGKEGPLAYDLRGFAVSPDGKRLAGCGSDVFVWDLETGRLIRQFYFNDRYNEVIFSPDGTKIAAIKQLQRRGNECAMGIVIGEMATGRHAEDWLLKEGSLLAFGFGGLAFSPDGKFLGLRFSERHEEKPAIHSAVSSSVWLLDAATGKRVRTLGSPDVPVACFAFQPGSGRLATYGKDGTIYFWDVKTGKEVQRFRAAKGKEENIFGVLRFSADGTRCAVLTDRAKFLTVLDAKDGRVIRRIEGKESWSKVALALSADGGTVASARLYEESCVRVWDVASGVERLADAGPRAAATTLSLSADGRALLSQDEAGRRFHWDLQTGKGEACPAVPPEENGHLIWSPDFSEKTLCGPRWRLVYKHLKPARMEVWSLDGARLIRKWEGNTRWVPEVALSPDGARLALSLSNAKDSNLFTLMLWDPEREEKPRVMEGLRGPCNQLLFSHDGKKLIGRTGWGNPQLSGHVWVWDWATARVVSKWTTPAVPGRLLLTADDRVLLIAGMVNDATLHAWDMETGKELARMADPSLKPVSDESNARSRPAITGLALSADDRFLAIVSSQSDASMVSVWETGSWKLIRPFPPIQPWNDGKAMVFSRDGRSLFVANNDSTILEWDVSGRLANGRPAPAGKTLEKDRLNILWRTLAETPDKAYPAVWELLDHPSESVRFLIDKVLPIGPMEEKRLRHLLAQLDSDSFAEREEASRQLRALGKPFLPMLRQALNNRPSLEMKKRLEGILESLKRDPSPEQLQLLRALAVLEWSSQPEAGEHLRRLAGGVPSSSLTQTAKAALQRRKR